MMRQAAICGMAMVFGAVAAPAHAGSPPPPWLTRINMYRAMEKLPPLANDRALTEGDQDHAVYLIKNFARSVRDGSARSVDIDTESSSKPFFTMKGRNAAFRSEVDFVIGEHESPERGIDLWMRGPHHRMQLLNPDLQRIGYGYYCEDALCVQTVDVVDGIAAKPLAPDQRLAIEFPPASSTLSLSDLPHESPNPLAACPGYAYPVGLPITFEIGSFVRAKLSGYSIVREDEPRTAPIEACGYDAYSYRNEARSQMGVVVGGLKAFSAVVVVPRYPLAPGDYRASVTVNDHEYSWSFSIAPNVSTAAAR